MRVQVATTHSITEASPPEQDDNFFEVYVDSDNTAQVRFAGSYDEDSCHHRSRWLGREELMNLRALISRAIGLLDDSD